MAYYCGECALWQGSRSENNYGERYCPHSGRYESADQNIYGCPAFIYVRRAVVTRTCEMLEINPEPYFKAFDEAKIRHIVPNHMNWLVSYCQIGPWIAAKMKDDPEGKLVAAGILERFIEPARTLCEAGDYEAAADLYREMVAELGVRYNLAAA